MKVLVMVLLLPVSGWAQAISDEDVNDQALEQTQSVLTNKTQRREAIKKGGPAAQQADDQAARLAGASDNLDQMYDIAAKTMPELMKQTNGDPQKMQLLLEKMKRDPASFESLMTPEARRQLHELADKIEKDQPSQPHH
jgi:hypothetical protein